MFEKLKKEFDALPKNFIVGLVIKSDKYEDINLKILDYFVNKKKEKGSYITVNRPYENIVEVLKEKNIDANSLYFIDCITKKLGGRAKFARNVAFIDSPKNLTELCLRLHQTVTTGKDRTFMFMDSLSTLSIYNEPEIMLKFIHYITGKMRLWKLNGIIISLHEETDRKLIAELSQFVDKMIRV